VSRGTLYLVPSPLDFGCEPQTPLHEVMPAGTLAVAARLSHWISENARSTRAYLKRIDASHRLALPIQALHIQELPRELHKKGDHDGRFDARALLAPALAGQDIGLVSEAGMPAIADPGASVVRAAHELGLAVAPLSGPVSLMLALAASGLNGQSFAFVGYLPQEAGPRTARIQALEALSRQQQQTQIAIETPYRNTALLQALVQALQPGTRLSVSCGLTLEGGFTRSAPVSAWRREPTVLPDKLPAVFCWLAR
jgi:16S rRNA (cytidine1402-2'-O)-methyltransferase